MYRTGQTPTASYTSLLITRSIGRPQRVSRLPEPVSESKVSCPAGACGASLQVTNGIGAKPSPPRAPADLERADATCQLSSRQGVPAGGTCRT